MSTVAMTAEEAFQSINGFDEIAIRKCFGADLMKMTEETTQLRALIFNQERKAGKTDAEAFQAAMELPMSAIGDYFETEVNELMPEEPVTEQGKED